MLFRRFSPPLCDNHTEVRSRSRLACIQAVALAVVEAATVVVGPLLPSSPPPPGLGQGQGPALALALALGQGG